jgi:hypothetical protein
LQANSRLPLSKVVSVGASSIIALRSAAPAGPPNPHLFRASIWAEVISPAAAASGGYLSWAADMDVDCQGRRSKAVKAVNYPQRNLQGPAKPASGAEDWVTPNPGTQLYSLISAVCDPDFHRPFDATTAKAETAALATSAERSTMAPAAQTRPAPASKAAPSPAPEPPVPSPPPKPAPAKAPGAVARVEPSAAKPSPAPPASKAIPKGHNPAAVQIAASDSQAQAEAALKTAQRRFAQPLQGLDSGVVKVSVGGKTVYRALIHGFTARSGAIALCKMLQAQRQACFVRNDFGR